MKIIDLSHEIKTGIPHFGAKWHIPFNIEELGRVDEVGRNTCKFTIGTHCATHIDAPRHFFDQGSTIEQIPLSTLCGAVSILDFRELKPNTEISIDMLQNYSFEERVIFVFGWHKMWQSDTFYQNYPYFSAEAAQFLVDQGVKFVAMDTPSPDDSRITLLSKEDSLIHKIFLQNGVILCEYLNNTDQINFIKKYNIYALPLKIKADGCPARVIIEEVADDNTGLAD